MRREETVKETADTADPAAMTERKIPSPANTLRKEMLSRLKHAQHLKREVQFPS